MEYKKTTAEIPIVIGTGIGGIVIGTGLRGMTELNSLIADSEIFADKRIFADRGFCAHGILLYNAENAGVWREAKK